MAHPRVAALLVALPYVAASPPLSPPATPQKQCFQWCHNKPSEGIPWERLCRWVSCGACIECSVRPCGVESCTDDVLETLAQDLTDGYTDFSSCASRINWVERNRFKSEKEACKKVAEEFPDECGACHPFQSPP